MLPGITAGIIAGGKSSRFGSPKTAALFRGKRLIDYALDLAASIATEVILNTNTPIVSISQNIRQIPDKLPDQGPAGGIYSVLQATQTPWVAILPCDMPLLPPEVYIILNQHRSKRTPVVAASEHGIEPLVSIWHCDMKQKVQDAIAGGTRSLQQILRKMNAQIIDVPPQLPNYQPTMFANVNRQSDLESLAEKEKAGKRLK